MRNPGYREQSLTSLAAWAAERLDRSLPLSDAAFATPRYDALLALFRRIDRGDPSLGIPRYDGGLFSADTAENRFLERHKLSDRAVARVVDIMVRDAGEPVDYAYISVRNLGTIYEGLLENRLVLTSPPHPLSSQERGPGGEVTLVNDRGERKLSGSYYTPDFIVEYIVSQTLDPILEERGVLFAAAMDRIAGLRGKLSHALERTTNLRLQTELAAAERDALEAFLGIKVCDPAMGSGHFLVNAVDHLTDGIIRRMQVYHDTHLDAPWEWNPVQRLVEQRLGRGQFLAGVAIRHRKQEAIPGVARRGFGPLQHFSHEGVGHIGDDRAEHVRTAGHQAARHLVGPVAQRLGQPLDLRAALRADARVILQGARDGRGRDLGEASDIHDRDGSHGQSSMPGQTFAR
jgi:hypothetical protein